MSSSDSVVWLESAWLECDKCGGKLLRKRTHKQSETVRIVECVCSACGHRHKVVESKHIR